MGKGSIRRAEDRRSVLRWLWKPRHGSPGVLSTARSFPAAVGGRIRLGKVAGYYIDFRFKSEGPSWPPPWLDPGKKLYVSIAQWGLGCYERYLSGEGEEWLAAAMGAGEHLLSQQERVGSWAGGWVHRFPLRHTFRVSPPWLSGMAQGEGASLLVRLHRESGDERFAEAAHLAVRPMRLLSAEGGVRARLDGGLFLEEYPTTPPSYVLNGGIFALWGCRDVGVGLDDPDALSLFEEGLDTLAANLYRFDTGYWSRYDLFPHPVMNIASSAYHRLHINQLRAMSLIAPRRELTEVAERFERYSRSRLNFTRAFARKVCFRLLVPRNRLLACRLPWTARRAA